MLGLFLLGFFVCLLLFKDMNTTLLEKVIYEKAKRKKQCCWEKPLDNNTAD